eukprot:GHVT01061212.1.p1 GENE.GHVT01061212.1~~GHVT01061212.1.p1  ORF type:complete len:328 (-),score=18.41 GHVT01061212.1:2530-3513(-)
MRGGVRDGRAWWALYLPLRAFVNAVTRPLLLMCLGFILAVLFSAPSLFHLQSHPPSDWRCFPSWRDSKFDSRCVAAIGSLGNFRLSNVPSILLASGLPSYQMSSSNPFSNYQPASYSSSYNQSPNYYPSYTASSSSNRPSSRGSTFYPRPSSSSYYPRASSSSSSGNVYRSQRTQQPRHSSRRTTQPAGRGASFDLPRSVRSSTSQFSATEPANQDVELTNLPSFPSSSDATPANIGTSTKCHGYSYLPKRGVSTRHSATSCLSSRQTIYIVSSLNRSHFRDFQPPTLSKARLSNLPKVSTHSRVVLPKREQRSRLVPHVTRGKSWQ